MLKRKAVKVAEAKGVECHLYNPKDEQATAAPDYVMMMVPVGPLVAASVKQANDNGIINIFAGIPADVHQDIDLNAFVAKSLYFIGTSGSTMEDMEAVLAKVNAGDLDTNLSVGAVSGMSGAIEGLEACAMARWPVRFWFTQNWVTSPCSVSSRLSSVFLHVPITRRW